MTKNMKRFACVFALVLTVALGAFAFFGAARFTAQAAGASGNGSASPADVTLGAATRGVVFYTAAINADGTIASCFNCDSTNTFALGTGEYQVDFGTNVQATNGFSRWVQADTLTTGSEASFCDTADRGGDANAVWINCQNAAGASTNTSFFLFVAR